MTKHEELGHKVLAAGGRSGDRAWPLPFSDDYNPAVKSTVADLCNDSNPTYRAGAITAGKFLQHFVGDVPWVHLDIAGTAFNMPDVSYYRPGATGFGVRLLVDLLTNWNK
jgi:leucyl aminopeptidase